MKNNMARQRIILPEYWLDSELAQCDYVVRLFYIGTWNFSDDYGVIEDDLLKLRSQIFPYDLSIDLLPIRDRLVSLKKLLPFEAEGKKWLYIKNFERFQRIERPSKWQNPEPPTDILGEGSVRGRRGVGEGNGRREEKRREEKGKYSVRDIAPFFISQVEKNKGFTPTFTWKKEGNLVKQRSREMTQAQMEDLINWYLQSEHSKRLGVSLAVCLSAHIINLWKADTTV